MNASDASTISKSSPRSVLGNNNFDKSEVWILHFCILICYVAQPRFGVKQSITIMAWGVFLSIFSATAESFPLKICVVFKSEIKLNV